MKNNQFETNLFIDFSYNYKFENNINNNEININLRQLKTFLANTKYIESYKNIIATIQKYIKSQNYVIRIKYTKFHKKFTFDKSNYLYVIYNKKKKLSNQKSRNVFVKLFK